MFLAFVTDSQRGFKLCGASTKLHACSGKAAYKNGSYLKGVKIPIESLSGNTHRKPLGAGLAVIDRDARHGYGQKLGGVNLIQGEDCKGCATARFLLLSCCDKDLESILSFV